MRKSTILFAMIPFFAACGATSFNQEEADAVATATNDLATEAYTSLYTDMSYRTTESELTWEDIEGGYTFSGSITSDGASGETWSGTMTVNGEFTGDDTSADWSFSVTYVDVAYDGTTYNGDMDWTWTVTYDDTGYTMENTVQGEVTASGEINGTGEIDYVATVTVTETGWSYTVHGTVGGHSVDEEESFDYGDYLD